MDSSQPETVPYARWNEDNINMNVEATQSIMIRIYNRMCTGRTGIAVKTAGALAALVILYIMGYATGYYVHKCG
ncbi:small integral membrane protein 1 [Betta splendens]|uniref:Small integral membrane protein 1 n=1 Tax=Betta splendens TaxID=158456 RepID=A0A6P7N4B7_BETSP|nr:small integral membrane protein 1 [Betta splendens]